MARAQDRLEHNAPGDLYVDSSCIDCDTCRWMAPSHFVQRAEQASVLRQPEGEEEWVAALAALVSCPTASIGTLSGRDPSAAIASLPARIDGHVWHTGFHGEGSFGAAPYLIQRSAGNVLVDSPRFTRPLVSRIEELGGVSLLFLTHRDDVLDHARWAAHFECERVLHVRDVRPSTQEVERQLEGEQPIRLADDLVMLPVPGHTPGSACLLFEDRYLFTGDHLAWSETRQQIIGFRDACWYDWDQVVTSTERLREQRFEWILPGHGRRCHFAADAMQRELGRCLEWMRDVA